MAAVTLVLPGDPMLMNELVRLAKAGRAGKAKGIAFVISGEVDRWMDLAYELTRKAIRAGQKPLPTPVTVTCTHLRTHHGVIDTMAVALACKSAMDGVVRAGLLPDDRDTLVVDTRFPSHRIAAAEGIELVIETVPGAVEQALLDMEDR
jgi:hypothetical protein